MLFSDQKELLTCICTQMLNESLDDPEQSHTIVMGFYSRLNCALPLMKWAVTHELHIKGIETSLFRGTTPAMRLLPAFYRQTCQDFLELCLLSFVQFFSRASITMLPPEETGGSPTHLGSACGESSMLAESPYLSDIPPPSSPPPPLVHRQSKYHDLSEAHLCMPISLQESHCTGKEFCECIEALLEHIFNVVQWCPVDFRRLLKFATEETGTVFPEQRGRIVSIFFYLRFIAPALASPEKYGLIPADEINEEGHKTLLVASRIIQWLANGAMTPLSTQQLPGEATDHLRNKIMSAMHQFEAELIDVDDEQTKLPRFSSLPVMNYNGISDILSVITNYQGNITRQLEKDFSDIHSTMFKRIMSLVQKVIKKHVGKPAPAAQYREELSGLDSACFTSKKSLTFTATEQDCSLDILALSHIAAATNALYQLRHERVGLEARIREEVRQEYAEMLEDVRAKHKKELAEAQEMINDLQAELRAARTEIKAMKRDCKKMQGVASQIVADDGFRNRRRVQSNAEKLYKTAALNSLSGDAAASYSLYPTLDLTTSEFAAPGPISVLATPRRVSSKHKHRHQTDLSLDTVSSPTTSEPADVNHLND